MPRISFSTLACPDWSWSEIVEKGRTYGYDGVEVRMIERDTDLLHRPEFAPSALVERRRELEQAGFRVCGLASSVRFDSPDPAERERQVQLGVEYLKLARALGGTFIRVFGDTIPADATAAERRAIEEGIAAGLQQLGTLAEPLQVDVLIETHGDYSDSHLMKSLLDRVSAKRVGVVWDTHHPWRFFDEPIAETFSRLGPWVRHTHWKDSKVLAPRQLTAEQAAAEEEARRLMAGHRDADYVLFGAGEFPAVESLRVLAAAGFSGWLSYEWEKAWHPEIAPPEEALPPFPATIREMWRMSSTNSR
jgi:sugar phosphate isomerase/epimerase